MSRIRHSSNRWLLVLLWSALAPIGNAAAGDGAGAVEFPTPLEAYEPARDRPLLEVLMDRVRADSFNLVATVLFAAAVVHTFLAGSFRKAAERMHHAHARRLEQRRASAEISGRAVRDDEVSFRAELLHFLGEVEAIFGLWVVPLLIAIVAMRGLDAATHYLSFTVNYTEPMFVVIIMTMAATRPVMRLAEIVMSRVAALGGGTPAAWWFSILTLGPLLGSLITEPAAMTISALLLARKFYELNPGNRLKYATLGLLFVNISVGGTLTHFAAPPVLMVAAKWQWGSAFMFGHYGWKAIAGILAANLLYFVIFRRELRQLAPAVCDADKPARASERPDAWRAEAEWPVPGWVTGVHLFFMGWTVFFAHYPALFIGGFLFFLAFTTATMHHQEELRLKPALLVGFFLAGLVVHGRLQQWWIEPVLGRLDVVPLMLGATVLTAFNDNAAITFLASLVPDFSAEMKYAVVAGAVTGGGLTVIANAPNPAGQSILQRFFADGVSPLRLLLGALAPTLILGLAYMALPF